MSKTDTTREQNLAHKALFDYSIDCNKCKHEDTCEGTDLIRCRGYAYE